MGGMDYVAHRYNDCSEEAMKKAVQVHCEAEAEDHGTLYSGRWGQKLGKEVQIEKDKVFYTEDEADDWLMNNAEKEGPLIAVRIGREWYVGGWCSS